MREWPAAVIFDFDGVLVDSEPLHCLAFRRTLKQFGFVLTREAYYRDLIGFDDRGAFGFFFASRGKKLTDPALKSIMGVKSEIMRGIIDAGKFKALPGARALVQKLARRYPLAICSGALRPEIELMLEGIGLREHFPVIVSAEDVKVGKPDPRGYLLTLKRLGKRIGKPLQPRDCLIVEDAPSVIQSVRSVGFSVLAVATSSGAEELAHANWVVRSLTTGAIRKAIPDLQLGE